MLRALHVETRRSCQTIDMPHMPRCLTLLSVSPPAPQAQRAVLRAEEEGLGLALFTGDMVTGFMVRAAACARSLALMLLASAGSCWCALSLQQPVLIQPALQQSNRHLRMQPTACATGAPRCRRSRPPSG